MATTACSASFHIGGSMDKEDVERQLSRSLEDQTGTKPDKVNCPDDLEGEKGATMKCVLESGGDKLPIMVTVTDVDGSDLTFHYEVADTTEDGSTSAATVNEAQLEDRISALLTEKVGQKPDEIDCPGNLPGKVGEIMECTLIAGSDQLGVTVTVTSVEGSTGNFDIEVEGS